jgi:glutamine synthetase
LITLPDLRQKFEAAEIRRVKVGAFDLDGVLRGKYISMEKFYSAAESGLGFCDVVFGWDIGDTLLDNVTFTGWHTSYPDALAVIDLDSFRTIPWEPGTAFFLLDLFTKRGEPLAISPRQVFRSVLKRAEERGFKTYFAAEFEFWFFKETPETLRAKGFRGLNSLTPGSFGYSVLRASQNSELVIDILENMSAFDVPLEGFHTETGPGVYEAAIAGDTGLKAADKAALFKTAMKEIGARHALIPTFMAKWNAELAGSGGHIHQSLWSDDTNLFYQGETMGQYIAGLTTYLPELMCLFCPTINSYKRMVPGTWAPINSTWGEDTRTTAVRSITGSEKSSRIELRLSGADINPYIAMAASLAAGLEGIEQKLTPSAPTTNAYASPTDAPLPRNLADAVNLFRASGMARKWFGDAFVDHYAATREWEVRQFEKAVTDWELARYFESI